MRPAEVMLDSCETGVCVQCGLSHSRAVRRAAIRLQAHLPLSEVAELWPCFYDGYKADKAVERMLCRDIAAMRKARR